MTFHFQLYPMLFDLGLVKNEDEYKAFAGERKPWRPWADTHAFHYSISAYAITEEQLKDTSRTLYHFPDLGFYTTRLELELRLESVKEWWGQGHRGIPEVFVRSGPWGYAIGLRVMDDWWKENKPKIDPAVIVNEETENYGKVRVTMAVFPYQAFQVFCNEYKPFDEPKPWWWPWADNRETWSNHQDHIKKIVSEKGWTNKALGGAEGIGYFGEDYSHKYVAIWLQDVI